MTEPLKKVWYDYEFHFSSGTPVYLSLLVGRDEIEEQADHIQVRIHEPDRYVSVRVERDKITAVIQSQRIEQQEVRYETPASIDFAAPVAK